MLLGGLRDRMSDDDIGGNGGTVAGTVDASDLRLLLGALGPCDGSGSRHETSPNHQAA